MSVVSRSESRRTGARAESRVSVATVVLAVVAAFGCQPPGAQASVDATLADGALVIEGVTDEARSWGAQLTSASAPAGEYLLFEANERPTSLAGLAAFDPEACPADCRVDGLGAYGARVKLDVPGPLRITAYGRGIGEDATRRYYVLARRGASAEPVAVKARIEIEDHHGGCTDSNPDPPALRTERLGGP